MDYLCSKVNILSAIMIKTIQTWSIGDLGKLLKPSSAYEDCLRAPFTWNGMAPWSPIKGFKEPELTSGVHIGEGDIIPLLQCGNRGCINGLPDGDTGKDMFFCKLECSLNIKILSSNQPILCSWKQTNSTNAFVLEMSLSSGLET